MNIDQAAKWIDQLREAVQAGKISKFNADDEVFAEMENGDHDKTVEDVFFNFTREEIPSRPHNQ